MIIFLCRKNQRRERLVYKPPVHEETRIEFSILDSFALNRAIEIVANKKWLNYPERFLTEMKKDSWSGVNTRYEYRFTFIHIMEFNETQKVEVTLNFADLADGIEGTYTASMSSPCDKTKGEIYAVRQDFGALTHLSIFETGVKNFLPE